MNTVDTLINLSPPAHRQPSSRVVQSMKRIEERSLVDDSRPTKGRLMELQPWGVCVCVSCIRVCGADMQPTRADTAKCDAVRRGADKGIRKHYIYIICIDIQNVEVCTDTRNYRSACSPAAAFASLPLAPQRSTCLKSYIFQGHLNQSLHNFFL